MASAQGLEPEQTKKMVDYGPVSDLLAGFQATTILKILNAGLAFLKIVTPKKGLIQINEGSC